MLCFAGIDQTRGWFYTLMVLSTALFDKPAFKSLVCNGLVLAEDGKKMSKRLKNYPVSRNVFGGLRKHLKKFLLQNDQVSSKLLRIAECQPGMHCCGQALQPR